MTADDRAIDMMRSWRAVMMTSVCEQQPLPGSIFVAVFSFWMQSGTWSTGRCERDIFEAQGCVSGEDPHAYDRCVTWPPKKTEACIKDGKFCSLQANASFSEGMGDRNSSEQDVGQVRGFPFKRVRILCLLALDFECELSLPEPRLASH